MKSCSVSYMESADRPVKCMVRERSKNGTGNKSIW